MEKINPTEFMREAFNEAIKGKGQVSPNPLVGAIIVLNDKIIGRGFHQKYGGNHAEVNAINDAKKNGYDLVGASIYINLEPCSHLDKKTPPCAPLLVQEKFKEVYISNLDPNPKVSGAGIKLLEESGIIVHLGILESDGLKLNEVFFKAMTKKMPFVHLKMAQTIDGKIASLSGESKYISSVESLKYVHELRNDYDAVLIGKNTLVKDNPSLTVRHLDRNISQPLRIVMAKIKELDLGLNLFSDEYRRNTVIVTTSNDLNQNLEMAQKIEQKGISLLGLKEGENGQVDLLSFLKTLYSLKVYSILLEGGPTLASYFLKEKLVDKITIVTAPYILGEGLSTFSNLGFNDLNSKIEIFNIDRFNLGKDQILEGYLCSQG